MLWLFAWVFICFFIFILFWIAFGILVAFDLLANFLTKDENVTVIVVRRKRYAGTSNRT